MVEFPSSKSRITRPAYVNVPESVTEAWDKSEGTLGRSTLVMLSSTKSSAWAFKSNSKEEREKKMTLSLDSWPPGDGEMFGLDWG